MNAFTQKPDLSKFLQQAEKSHKSKKGGLIRAARQSWQVVPGMGNRDISKTQIQKAKK